MDMSGQFAAHDSAEYMRLSQVCEADVRQTMLERSLARPFRKRLINVIPLAVLLITAATMPNPLLIYPLAAAQALALLISAIAAKMLITAYQRENKAHTLYAVWLFTEGMSGAIWGLMLYSISNPGLTGHTATIIAVTVCGTVIAGVIKASSTPGSSRAQMIGFAATSIPISLIFLDSFGYSVTIALIAMPVAAMLTSEQVTDQARSGIRTEIENALLASHLAQALQVADFMSRHDSLTNLLNRRELANSAERLKSNRPDQPMVVMLLDLDHFKTINDRFGHGAGDNALQATADILMKLLSDSASASSDSHALARWGGEEFVAVIADCSAEQARQLADAVRTALARHDSTDWPKGLQLTASFGTTTWQAGEPLNTAIARADKAMYSAKQRGRNRFVFEAA